MDFYFDVVCPWAFMASREVDAVARSCGVEVRWRPILLGGILKSVGAPNIPAAVYNSARAQVAAADLIRQGKRRGLEIRLPPTHPQRTVEAMRLILAAPDPRGIAEEFFTAYWVEARDVTAPGVLAAVARNHGLDVSLTQDPSMKRALIERTADAVAQGVFGVPSFVLDDGALFWGVDRLPLVAQRLGAGRTKLTFFHDFSSPFSYLASTQVARVAAEGGTTVEWVPILLGALFRDIGAPNVPLLAMNKQKQRYYLKDIDDWASWWGVPLRFPTTFPLRTVTALRVALAEPRATPFIYRAAWVDNLDIGNPETLAAALTAAGLDGPSLLERAQDPEIKAALRTNTTRAIASGVCGVPTFIAKDTLVWGQDRLDEVAEILRPEPG